LFAFIKYNLIAIIATAIDFMVYVLLNKLNVWYVYAAVSGAVAGGLFAFWYNRNWVFQAKNGNISRQSARYISVWLTSIGLNTLGIYLLVDKMHTGKILSKIIVAVIVGVFFNFLMNKYFVFNRTEKFTIKTD